MHEQSSIRRRLSRRRRFRLWSFLLLVVISAIAIFLLDPLKAVGKESNYTIHATQDFNQPQFYPIAQKVPSVLYRPVGNWVGRLVLPGKEAIQAGTDWAWMEVQFAPKQAQNLVGKVVRLEWKNKPELQSYVQVTTRDVKFTPGTKKSLANGIVHPFRLDGRIKVGPLQSLAGARPNDDVIVSLDKADIGVDGDGQPVIQIEREPELVTGRYYGLVKILQPEQVSSTYPAAKTCPGNPPCKSEYFQVRHFNSADGNFNGPVETIRVPQQVLDTRKFFQSTPYKLEDSPAGKAGWYIYGAKDAKGIFIVQGLAPRSLFQLQPNQVVLGTEAGIKYIKWGNWKNLKEEKGKVKKVLVDGTAQQSAQALSNWKEGDKAIVMHAFGGIGGKNGEFGAGLTLLNTIPGHFAFGLAQIVRDPFTKELQFDVKYQQVYANNPDGLISGTHSWANYMGNLQWGWAATRPISDILIKYEPLTQDYNFNGITLSPMREFMQQLQVMMARYRIGDGTGSATVDAATSCVQDSNQALYSTIKVIRQRVDSTPAIQKWLEANPNDPQTLRFQELVSLSSDLERQLSPLGIVRADWNSNADILTGVGNEAQPFRDRSFWAGLTSWRTMMPRQAHDGLSTLLLRHGGKLWFLSSTQIGGWQQDIFPIEPTAVLGRIKIPFTEIAPIPTLLGRILGSLVVPNVRDFLVVLGTLLIYGSIVFPLGIMFGFFQLTAPSSNWVNQLLPALRASIIPAFVEELVFRVLLLPHPTEVVSWLNWSLWGALSVVLFILYHPLNAKTFFKPGIPIFFKPIFLLLTALLGLSCTIAYGFTGSLWTVASIHFVVLLVWLLFLGGTQKLHPKRSLSKQAFAE